MWKLETHREPGSLGLVLLLASLVLLGCGASESDRSISSQAEAETVLELSQATREFSREGARRGENPGPLILFLGDSLSAGRGVTQDEAFPAVVEATLHKSGIACRIVNAGVSGDTTAGGLQRLDWLLQQDPDLVVVELGANDGLRGLPTEAMEENLRQILRRLAAKEIDALLVGIRIPPNYGPEYAGEFASTFPRLSEEFSVPILPFLLEGVAGDKALNQADGIHPTVEGHQILAENIEPLLRIWLADFVSTPGREPNEELPASLGSD